MSNAAWICYKSRDAISTNRARVFRGGDSVYLRPVQHCGRIK